MLAFTVPKYRQIGNNNGDMDTSVSEVIVIWEKQLFVKALIIQQLENGMSIWSKQGLAYTGYCIASHTPLIHYNG